MQNPKTLALLILVFLLTSCVVKRTFYINNNDLDNKKVVFSLHGTSDYKDVIKYGDHFGNSKDPIVRDVFEKSIKDLANETKLDLEYSTSYVFKNNTIIPVNVTIKGIEWEFADPKATMYVTLEYKMPKKTLEITGVHQFKAFMIGTKTRNLYKSLQDGHKQFLSAITGN